MVLHCTDNEAPVIACPANQTVNTELNQMHATVVWTDPQVSDNSRETPTITCDYKSRSNFGIGNTEVLCQAVDPSGNHETCMFTVKIEGNDN